MESSKEKVSSTGNVLLTRQRLDKMSDIAQVVYPLPLVSYPIDSQVRLIVSGAWTKSQLEPSSHEIQDVHN
jgi:hypothetical protein